MLEVIRQRNQKASAQEQFTELPGFVIVFEL